MPSIGAFAAILLLSALLTPAAMAGDTDSATPRSTTGSAVVDQPPIPQAPIGHRQPRPGDVPAVTTSQDDEWLNRLNRETDRKLNICRGC